MTVIYFTKKHSARKNISVRQRKYKKRLSERAVKNNLMKIHKNEFYLIFDIY